uniref:Membrane-associated protein n=1 Tax=Oryza meridionalis TaxID=40149 RepID=A0A0E0CCI3_9ORYZ
MARRSNPALISTLCCFTALLSLAFVCLLLPYVCPSDGDDDDAGLTSVWPVLVRTDAATLMHNDCRRVHPSTAGVVPTFVSAGSESQHHQPVNFNCSMPSTRIVHGTRTDDSSPPPASAAVVVGSNGKPRRRVVTALPELINSDLAAQLVTMIIIVLADLAADQRKKKKSGRMAPLLIVLLLQDLQLQMREAHAAATIPTYPGGCMLAAPRQLSLTTSTYASYSEIDAAQYILLK